jgi:hypothetical protein
MISHARHSCRSLRVTAFFVASIFCAASTGQEDRWGPLLFGIAPAIADSAVLDCGDFWTADDLPHARSGSALRCIEYRPSSATSRFGPGRDHRIFYPAYWERYPRPTSLRLLETLAEGLTESIDRLGGLLPVYPMYVVVSDHLALHHGAEDWDTLATAAGTWIAANEPCPIVIYSSIYSGICSGGLESCPDKLKQVVAHEVFHCLQSAHFGDRMDDDYEARKWWTEGTAEYFSSVVYPRVNGEHEYARDYSPDTEILLQDYENVVFFQYLADQGGLGDRGVLDLIRRMPTTETFATEQRALAAFPGMQDLLHGFGRAFLDENIRDGGGGIMPVRVNRGATQTIVASGTVALEARSFTLGRVQIALAPGRRYQVTSRLQGADGRLSVRRRSERGDWTAMPSEIETDCDSGRVYYVLATSAAQSTEKLHVRLTFQSEQKDCGRCSETNRNAAQIRADRCLLGQWKATASSMERYLSAAYSRVGSAHAQITNLGVRGEGQVRFTPGGRFFVAAREVQARSRIDMGSVSANITVTTNGPVCGNYWADGSMLKIWDVDNHAKSESTVALAGGPATTTPISHAEHQVPGTFERPAALFQYRCDTGNVSLTLKEVNGQPTENVKYELVRAPR